MPAQSKRLRLFMPEISKPQMEDGRPRPSSYGLSMTGEKARPPWLNCWVPKAADLLFQRRRHRYHQLFLPWTRHDLHSDGQAFRRLPHRNHDGWHAQQIEPFGIAPGIDNTSRFSLDLPACARHDGMGIKPLTKQHDNPHLGKHLHSHYIAIDPGFEQ
jgi:hypothetical protein